MRNNLPYIIGITSCIILMFLMVLAFSACTSCGFTGEKYEVLEIVYGYGGSAAGFGGTDASRDCFIIDFCEYEIDLDTYGIRISTKNCTYNYLAKSIIGYNISIMDEFDIWNKQSRFENYYSYKEFKEEK